MVKETQMIKPFEKSQVRKEGISYGVSSYGYDARVSNEFKIFTNVNSEIVDPKNFKPSNKNLKYLITDSKGKILQNSFDLVLLIENTNWKKL